MEIRYIGGPTATIDFGGVRFLTDPTFDEPGDYPLGGGRTLTKTAGPAFVPDAADVVLLSHDQHPDNLDKAGRAFLERAPLTLSTRSAAERIAAVRALPRWEEVEVEGVRITAVPAQHGPDGTEHLTGEVTGFVLRGEGLPTTYVSGDNASLDVVREIAGRIGRVDVAVLFAGAARTKLLGEADLTLSSAAAAEAARILGARDVVPLHFEHWKHFTQGRETLAPAFAGFAGFHLLEPGERISLS
ncbi:MBL fold metallo-hydrolase [Thermoactinospora rubra]|uniref:MBL fold metallo-hydrolase n=1 Tax=Thermoactinospora rubra TaxID=1088767 RepID=UPI000A0FF7CE|nr:MBL fold metallo-hydrolase [Thermoactinospora rubra]